jgi:uncharacterized protein YcbX
LSLKVESLAIYPIKSCHGVEVRQFQIGESGPQLQIGEKTIGDREWMFVDSEGKFITQRSFPKMALLRPQIEDQKFYLQLGSEKFEIPLNDSDGSRQIVSVWGKEVDAFLPKLPLNEAMSDYMGFAVRLAHFDHLSSREILIKGKGQNAQTRFTDSQAYLILTAESLQDLNSRMEHKISANRFRGNVVLSGGRVAYAEDEWKALGNSSVDFEPTKACARCKIITVDPNTGEIPNSEPLVVLSKYRRIETAVYFGQYFLSRSYGEILKVGDRLEAQS